MLKRNFRVCFISDIHLFHKRTPTIKIIEELKTCFPDNEETASIDAFYFVGDVFDQLYTYHRAEVTQVEQYFAEFLRMCKRNNQQVRILEGTPSHDWKQSLNLVKLNQVANIHADLVYYDDLTIAYNEKWGIYELYIPDEYHPQTEVTLSRVKQLMAEKGIDKVDLTLMHGQFNYQLPAVARAPKHDEESYLNLTRYYISIGHVHTSSTYDRIIAQGSFSRLKHDEEEAKGYVIADLFPDGHMRHEFKENKTATIYKTIDVRNLNLDDIWTKIKDSIKDLPEQSHIRIHANKGDPILIQSNYQDLVFDHVAYIWSTPKVDDPLLTQKEENEPEVDLSVYHPVTLTPENIESLMTERLINLNYAPDRVNELITIFKGVI